MKIKFTKSATMAIMLFASLFLSFQGVAEPFSPKADVKQGDVAFVEAIKEISVKFEVFFTFDLKLVEGIQVDEAFRELKTVENAVEYVLQKTDLKYRIIDTQYVIIYKDNVEGIESLKEMSRHLDGLITEGEKAAKELNERNDRVVSKLVPRQLARAIAPVAFSVNGTVIDDQGEPLIGVNIQVKGTNKGTSTDFEGNFTLDDIDENAVLVLSYVGYTKQEISIDGRANVTITLLSDSQLLDEVVVVGYGTQKKVNLTGAVSSMTADKLSVVPTGNVSSLLYGNLPGLIPLQRSGEPGEDDVALSIRGFSNALVVVDGVVGRDFARLDPSEIESVTILKDAASSAVYGVSGGNGVILVTTKKGTVGKPVFNYTMNYGVQQITKYPRFVNSEEYAILKNESAVNLGGSPVYSQEEVQKFRDGTDPNYPNFDYFDYFIRENPPQFQQNISVRGGSEKIKYFFLLGQYTQASMYEGGNQDYAKYNFRSNVDVSITDNLDISISLGGRVENRDNLIQSAYLMSSWMQYSWPIHNPQTPDGKIASTNYGLTAYLDRDLTGYVKDQRNVYEGALSINYKIPYVPGLSANVTASRDMYLRDQKQWLKKFDSYRWDEATQTSVYVSSRGVDQLILDNWKSSFTRMQASLNYDRSFGGVHNVKGLFLYEVSEDEATNFYASRSNYVLPIDQIFAGPDLDKGNGGSASDNGRESYIGRVNYDYKGKYLLEYSFRYDGSAKFPPDRRWGFFSGLSAGWRVSEESFIRDNFNNIDNLKIRGSWGKLGSDNTGNFQYLTGYTYPASSYVFGGKVVTAGLVDSGTPNPRITWEESQIYNLGVDIGLWNGLLQVETDVFYRKRDGLLATRATQLPSTFGATLPAENLNSDDTRGFEVLVGHRSSVGEVQYNLTSNFSFSRTKNTHLEQTTFDSQLDNWRWNREERWNNLFWGYEAIGQFQSTQEILSSPIQDGAENSTLRPGDIKYEDLNMDGVINSSDNQIIGRTNTPEINYGLGLNVSWKRISVNMNWQGASNFDLRQSSFLIYPFNNGMNSYAYLMDRWRRSDPTDPNSTWIPGKYPSSVSGGAPNNKYNSSFWLFDASYIRLKSLGINYNLQSEFLKKIKVQGLDISLSGQNILTFSGLGPVDPEAPEGRLSYYPQQKTYNVGINIKF